MSKAGSKVREMGNPPGAGVGPKPAVHEEVSPEPERQVLGNLCFSRHVGVMVRMPPTLPHPRQGRDGHAWGRGRRAGSGPRTQSEGTRTALVSAKSPRWDPGPSELFRSLHSWHWPGPFLESSSLSDWAGLHKGNPY